MDSLASEVSRMQKDMSSAVTSGSSRAGVSGAVTPPPPPPKVSAAKRAAASSGSSSSDELAKVQRQKEENLRKQELLRQSLSAKHTALVAEQTRLARVNAELKELEMSHARDVEKLREMIEDTSSQLSSKMRVFKVKEKEYYALKEEVDQLNERRNNLTEHLTKIILDNESRKADKLAEIMAKLGTAADSATPALSGGSARIIQSSSPVTSKPIARSSAAESFGGFADD